MKHRALVFAVSVLFLVLLCFICTQAEEEGDSFGDISSGESPTEEADFPFPDIELKTTYLSTDTGEGYLLITSEAAQDSTLSCLVLVPWGETVEKFLEQTEWNRYSLVERFQLIGITADWAGKPEESRVYFDHVYEKLESTLLSDQETVFLIGYDDAADFASEEAILHTRRYAGLVTLGGEGIEEDRLTELSGEQESSPLSVWTLIPKKTSQITKNISYWKNVNGITGAANSSYRLRFADELYLPATSTAGKITGNEDRMGIVLVSRESEYQDPNVTGNISRNFISQIRSNQVSFREQITGGEVFGFNIWNFTYNRMQFEGQQRDFWVYTPFQTFFGEEQSSLILCLHGSGGNGEDMIFRTMWHETAQEQNIVVLYPSSLYKNGYQHYWQNTEDELSFLRELVEWACAAYHIDRSRIYVTGYSNGAGMAQNLAMRCSDLFAAAALSAPVYYDEEYFGPIEEIHEEAILFSYGSEDKYLVEYNMTAAIDDLPALNHLAYWRGMYGFSQDLYTCEIRGKFTTYTFQNRYHIPVVKWIIVEGKGHSYPQEEVDLYYEFLSHYEKGENGELYYDDILVKSK